MDASHGIVFTIFLVFTGAAVVATLALFARQALIVAYILVGALVGPGVLGWIDDPKLMEDIAGIGIMFLLYLLGLNLYPQKLLQMLQQAMTLTLATCLLFALVGVGLTLLLGFTAVDALVVGAALMFSSTILGLKLLPTTALHHRHAGEVIISVLLIQDVIAILILLALQGIGSGHASALDWLWLLSALPVTVGVAFVLERWVLVPLLSRFDQIQEYVFLLTIGWCLGIAQLSHALGLSHEIGAFIAGVALASSPVARFIAESLKPLRDFFLVIFFFSLGASLRPDAVIEVIGPALVLVAVMLVIKPLAFSWMLKSQHETGKLSREIGVRLGQISEFSLLIAIVALQSGVVSQRASTLIQVAALLGFIVSSYWIVMRYPTPIAVSDRLRRD